jgi:hypothetical protein
VGCGVVTVVGADAVVGDANVVGVVAAFIEPPVDVKMSRAMMPTTRSTAVPPPIARRRLARRWLAARSAAARADAFSR